MIETLNTFHAKVHGTNKPLQIGFILESELEKIIQYYIKQLELNNVCTNEIHS
jgi:hypothetical protein